ncbi:mitotic spindle assembly checkpoint protein MAD2A [Pteropus alecto]|uniref:mitotic spindle assembly checkpoint protein MAD2A n=1 Tax=Pteropus alecto TaxID=9402 RepID=UPI00076875E2|nr:mitotic spindle assembly checkpoint protein MAD2A [Pteropus alecto]
MFSERTYNLGWTLGSNEDGKGRSGEVSEGNENHLGVPWRKDDPCHEAAETLCKQGVLTAFKGIFPERFITFQKCKSQLHLFKKCLLSTCHAPGERHNARPQGALLNKEDPRSGHQRQCQTVQSKYLHNAMGKGESQHLEAVTNSEVVPLVARSSGLGSRHLHRNLLASLGPIDLTTPRRDPRDRAAAFGINSILYQRGVYPSETFTRVQKYGLTLLVTTDPELMKYLNNVVEQLKDWLYKCSVQKLVVVISNIESGEVLERWQFDIECDKTAKDDSTPREKSQKAIQDEIRSVIRQITATVTFLPLLEVSCSFDLLIYTDKDLVVPEKWEESGPQFIANSEQVRLRSFTTTVHKVNSSVAYKIPVND